MRAYCKVIKRLLWQSTLLPVGLVERRETGDASVSPTIMEEQNQSEVARIKREIELEQLSAHQAMHGTALGMSKHEFITRRMQRMGELSEELKKFVGEEEAGRYLKETMEGKRDGKE